MLIPHCDRCCAPGQVIQVLGKDCCNACVAELREWLNPIAKRVRKAHERDRMHQARHFIARDGEACAAKIAASTGEPYRNAYSALIACAKRGKLVHLGKGKFVLPAAEAAE